MVTRKQTKGLFKGNHDFLSFTTNKVFVSFLLENFRKMRFLKDLFSFCEQSDVIIL